MSEHKVFSMAFSKIYALYVQKAMKKNRTEAEVVQIICWLTAYRPEEVKKQVSSGNDFASFFAAAPKINPNTSLIKGGVCGVRVDEIEDPLMRNIRYLDKLIDELAKGKAMVNILRN
ncbi:hypothetical protein FX988_01190 [Paraglaciecola mesophila]|uniref:DUF2200 domain-containing protein n=1 Tax=Paraglaciecola mesophila TaxID=197222 RepID=A0A857JI98_9ALTE|nr:DUF2200 domain-containing protein [Paraglaciecola mesophila]QHJ10968.1 hypothetical protein FX988_01190 [Paraglaciecola mesophila]